MWAISLQLLCLALFVASGHACDTDADCTRDRETCTNSSCTCIDGFENVTGTCTKVLGKSCTFSSDCWKVANAECTAGTCSCRSRNSPSFYEVDHVCETVIGRPCTDKVECLDQESVSCRDNECKCFQGYSQTGNYCNRVTCNSELNCTDSNTTCDGYYCDCLEGFGLKDGVCTKVLGRECGSDAQYYCDYSANTTCDYTSDEQVCVCYAGYREKNGKCIPDLGENCQGDSECSGTGMQCDMGTCQCTGSYYEDDSSCRSIYGSSCLNISDCLTPLMQNVNCSGYSSYLGNSRCECVTGAFFDWGDRFCKKIIGSECSPFSSSRCLSPPYFCDSSNACSCGFGTVVSDDELSCISVINKSCSSSEDCSNTNMYKCDNGQCVCSDAYISHGYNEVWNYHIPCVKAIGRHCNATGEPGCNMPNAVCNEESVCVCEDGFIEIDGNCIKGLGTTCHHDLVCHSFDMNSICALDGTCQCKNGFKVNGNICYEVLMSSCLTNTDCDIDNAICSEGNQCTCKVGFTPINNQCFDESGHCAETIARLPDLKRRLAGYTSNFPYEEAIDDSNREETWYSIGERLPLISVNSPAPGSCGTAFPIYIESIADGLLESMNENEIDVVAKVAGLDEFGMTEALSVKLRRCGNDNQMYIKRPTTKLAAYCLGKDGDISMASRPDNRPEVISELHFNEEHIEGKVHFQPFLVFKCDLNLDEYIYSYMYYGSSIRHHYDTYFIVNWYIDGEYLTSYGPVTRENLNDTNLLESKLLSFEINIGFKIQCSYQTMDSLSGVVSSATFSPKLDTNIKTNIAYKQDLSSGYNYISPELQVPLGCASSKNDTAYLCKYRLDLMKDGGPSPCPMSSNENDLCGVVLNATTFYGNGYQLYESYYDWNRYTYNSYDEYEDENGHQYKEYIRSNLSLIEGFEEVKELTEFRAVFDSYELDTGHTIWRGYKLKELKIYPYDEMAMPSIRVNTIGSSIQYNWRGFDIQGSFGGYDYDISNIKDGEYIMYRSKKLPVEIQIEIENATICGLVVRSGNSIRIERMCGNRNIFGCVGDDTDCIDWDVSSYNTKIMVLEDGLVLSMYTSGGIGSITVTGFENSFKNAEGVLALANGFTARDGSTPTSVSELEKSWKISVDESLRNPANQKTYRYQKKYYLCECPASTEVFEDRISFNKTIQFNGALRCTTDYPCEESIEGSDEWPNTLRPLYVINNVTLSVEAGYQESPTSLVLKCDFDLDDGYFYNIKWNVDGVLALESGISAKSDVVANREQYLATVTLVESFSNLSLNSEMICSAGVYASQSDSDPLLPYKNSSSFIPVEITNSDRSIQKCVYHMTRSEVKNEIITNKVYLARGGQAVISLKRNIPLVCDDCHIDIKVIDADDEYDCDDSTVAVVSETMCGHTITGSPSPTFESSNIAIKVTTINSKKYTLRTFYSLQLKLHRSGVTDAIWGLPFNTSVSLYVTDNYFWQGRMCYVNNDPRAKTFDGIYYYIKPLGEFVLWKHTSLDIQVQVKTMSCNRGWGTCSCAVTIQAGQDVFTVNHCAGHHITDYLLNDGESVLVVTVVSTNRYKIMLPQGTVVDVQVSPWRWYIVNLNIYPSPSDVGNVWGLCGNYNGDISDDFRHRDGTEQKTSWGHYYYNSTNFIESWRVDNATESLININQTKQFLKPWSLSTDKKCICPNDNMMICAANEQEICIQSPSATSSTKILNRTSRNKRSTMISEETARKLRDIQARSEIDRVVKRSADANAITLEEAKRICNESLFNSCDVMSIAGDLPVNGTEALIQDCAEDYKLNPEVEWAGQACKTFEIIAEVEIEKNTTFQNLSKEIIQVFDQKKCPGMSGCAGNGVCVNGKCQCNEGFGSEDCFIDLTIAPQITLTMTNGACDKNTDNCAECIPVTTDGTLESVTCSVTITVINLVDPTEDGPEETYTFPAVYINFNEIECCLPEPSRRKRSTTSASIAEKYGIAISNDGVNFGDITYMYVLDTTCQETGNDSNGNTLVLLKTGYCYIEGVCKENNTRHSTETCRVCKPDANAFQWTEDGCSTAQSSAAVTTSKEQDNTVMIIVIVSPIVAVLSLTFGGVAFAAYMKKKNRINPEMPPPRYPDQVLQGHFSRHHETPWVKDEKY